MNTEIIEKQQIIFQFCKSTFVLDIHHLTLKIFYKSCSVNPP